MRILLVEDEENIRELVKLNLELEGYETVVAKNGKQALKFFAEQHFDLIILDIMLPEISGLQVAEQVRLSNLELPILMLTAKDTPADRILGLRIGADDYLTKPFVLEELLLRVQKLLQRSAKGNTGTPETFESSGPSGQFILTKKEIMLLKLLIDRRNEVVSRQQILQSVWGYDVYPSTRTIDNFILAFRKYFEPDPRNPQYFHSIRGVGYKLVC